MGLPKGQTNNLKGRTPGSKNKLTVSQRTWLNAFLIKNRRQLKEDWKALKPSERVQLYERLLSYTTPKMQIDFKNLPDDVLDLLLTELKSSLQKQ
jgi:hypothetical protein